VTRSRFPFSIHIHSCIIRGVYEFLVQLCNNQDVRAPVIMTMSNAINVQTIKDKYLNTSCTNVATERKGNKTPCTAHTVDKTIFYTELVTV
jgi:hypothetical protein